MGKRWAFVVVVVTMCVYATMSASAVCIGVELLVNGDAETGDLSGWTPTDQIEVRDAEVGGEPGIDPGETGQFVFTAGTGAPMESAHQRVDLTALAPAIDAGRIDYRFAGLIQSRRVESTIDAGTVRFRWLDASEGEIERSDFVDASFPSGVFDWHAFTDHATLPIGTRAVEVTLIGTRSAGVSTEAFFDNLSLILESDLPTGDFDLDGDVDAFDLGIWQTGFGVTSGASVTDGDADCDGDVDAFDLGLWQTNFGAATTSAAPEPATAALLALGAVALGRRRSVRSAAARPVKRSVGFLLAMIVGLGLIVGPFTSDADAAQVFGLKSRAAQAGTADPSEPPTILFTFDSAGGPFTELGPVTRNGAGLNLDALAVSLSNELIAYELIRGQASNAVVASQLVRVNPTDQTVASIGSPVDRDMRGAAFDAVGRLWTLDSLNDQLVRIDPATGGELDAIDLTLDGGDFALSNISDIAFDARGVAWVVALTGAAAVDGTDFFTLDTATGALTRRGTDATSGSDGFFPGFAGNAFSPEPCDDASKMFTYDIIFNEDIFAHDVDDGFVRSNVHLNIIPQFNAGRGDLAARPIPEVILTGDFDLDGDVDAFDLGIWQTGFGVTSGASVTDGDADCDGDVDAFDLGLWQTNFGTGVTSAAPEPATAALLLSLIAIATRRQRSR